MKDILDIIVKFCAILSFLGISVLITDFIKNCVQTRKAKKQHINNLLEKEKDESLRKIIREELLPVKDNIAKIVAKEAELKKCTSELINDRIDELYKKVVENNDKAALDKLLGLTNDPIYIPDDLVAAQNKINYIKEHYAFINQNSDKVIKK